MPLSKDKFIVLGLLASKSHTVMLKVCFVIKTFVLCSCFGNFLTFVNRKQYNFILFYRYKCFVLLFLWKLKIWYRNTFPWQHWTEVLFWYVHDNIEFLALYSNVILMLPWQHMSSQFSGTCIILVLMYRVPVK